ncbi:MAG: hypothetical protein MJZ37_07995 [Bacilli bacterium]|nr:hypothetical protein [Bacilli bacterium]
MLLMVKNNHRKLVQGLTVVIFFIFISADKTAKENKQCIDKKISIHTHPSFLTKEGATTFYSVARRLYYHKIFQKTNKKDKE